MFIYLKKVHKRTTCNLTGLFLESKINKFQEVRFKSIYKIIYKNLEILIFVNNKREDQ